MKEQKVSENLLEEKQKYNFKLENLFILLNCNCCPLLGYTDLECLLEIFPETWFQRFYWGNRVR